MFFLIRVEIFIFLKTIISEISCIRASAISKISFFLIFLKFCSSKNCFSTISSSKFSFEKLEFRKILIIVSFLIAVTFEISFKISFVPKLNFSIYFVFYYQLKTRLLFSKSYPVSYYVWCRVVPPTNLCF